MATPYPRPAGRPGRSSLHPQSPSVDAARLGRVPTHAPQLPGPADAGLPAGPSLDDPRLNRAGPDDVRVLPDGFLDFLAPLHSEFTPRQQGLVARRHEALADAHAGFLPVHLATYPATSPWSVELPDWCLDQRNQMTGPADDAELAVKMLNSGAPGVMLDLEDSVANTWPHTIEGIDNAVAALHGELTYRDRRDKTVGVEPSSTVIYARPRGLHLHQAGVVDGALVSASLFDVAFLAWRIDPARLRHPLCIYIPKSESAEESAWWRDVLQAIATSRGWPRTWIRCMALVESHPLAYQVEEFAWELREHLLGLNLGRWDYLASLAHWTLADPAWVLPDRNTIPHDVPFFQRLRELLVATCHAHGLLAIGGMTALYPSRQDAALNARALAVLEEDKRNEAAMGMDGAWTGHPDQNAVAVAQFPVPNQLAVQPRGAERFPELRPSPAGVGTRTLAGSRAAVRTVIRYRAGVLEGRGASLLDGYMEDLATDRIYRLMLAQRMRHAEAVEIAGDDGRPVRHSRELVVRLFDEELVRLMAERPDGADPSTAMRLARARDLACSMVLDGVFDPV
jgi:malate synthase